MSHSTTIESATPLFLIGPPRTGTTILSKLLNAHTNVLLTNETAVFIQLNRMIKESAIGSSAGIMFGKSYHGLWASHLQSEARNLIQSFYTRIAEVERKSRILYWGEKHPHLSECLDFITKLYPNAKYIYSIRDPRDTICSIAEMANLSIEAALKNWAIASDFYENFIASIPHKNIIISKYEDLVKNYDIALESILLKLDLKLDDTSRQYLKEYKRRDSHKSNVNQIFNFSEKSVGRWPWEMTRKEKALVQKKCQKFLARYEYAVGGKRPKRQSFITFQCNVCGSKNRRLRNDFGREDPSCETCHSTVRARAIVHLLSMEIFGESLTLLDFPKSKNISGIGLSDWPGYADFLEERLSYRNFYYHKEPFLDISNPNTTPPVDFLIASEVFQHVRPPVHRAFNGALSILKNGGLVVFTTPFGANLKDTIEHFPELDDYKLIKRELDGQRLLNFDSSEYDLINTTSDGRKQVFRNVRLHEGEGETLEMRVFSMRDLIDHFHKAGFTKVVIRSDDYPKYGIIWLNSNSTPIVAYKPFS